jgi:hypothetical protein
MIYILTDESKPGKWCRGRAAEYKWYYVRTFFSIQKIVFSVYKSFWKTGYVCLVKI